MKLLPSDHLVAGSQAVRALGEYMVVEFAYNNSVSNPYYAFTLTTPTKLVFAYTEGDDPSIHFHGYGTKKHNVQLTLACAMPLWPSFPVRHDCCQHWCWCCRVDGRVR